MECAGLSSGEPCASREQYEMFRLAGPGRFGRLWLFPLRCCGCRRVVWLRRHDQVGFDLLRALGDDGLADFQSVFNDPHRINTVADLDGPYADLVVRPDDGDAITALQFTDGALRDKQRVRLRTDDGADAPIFARPQDVARIRE